MALYPLPQATRMQLRHAIHMAAVVSTPLLVFDLPPSHGM
jgi:hypothetical protein